MVVDEKEFQRFAIEFAGLVCVVFEDQPDVLAKMAKIALNSDNY